MIVRSCRVQHVLTTIVAASFALVAVPGMSQFDDPFGDDPFAPPPAGQQAPSAAPADPFSFDAPPAPAPAAAPDPFGAPTADPFGGPFGAPQAAPPAAAPSADPFGDPFSAFGSIFGSPTDFSAFTSPDGVQATGVTQIYQFRYQQRRRATGERLAIRTRMTQEEAEAFDNRMVEFYAELAREGRLPNFQQGVNDPDNWARWMLYAQQVNLWRDYVRQTSLVGAELEEDELEIQWPGSPRGEQANQQGAGDGQYSIYATESLDDQVTNFFEMPNRNNQQGQPATLEPSMMNTQMEQLYRRVVAAAREKETEEEEFLVSLRDDLRRRANRREAYAEWRQSQQDVIREFVTEWQRRYEGQVTTIAGVRYELFRPEDVPSVTTRGATIVVTDYDLTPYDILDSEGRLRGPQSP